MVQKQQCSNAKNRAAHFFSDLINTELGLHNSYPTHSVGHRILKAQDNIRNIFI